MTVLPLAGVALGSAGTLIGQYLSTRVEARRVRHEQASAARTERKEAIMEFLAAAQQMELLLDHVASGHPYSEPEIWAQLHALWLAKKLPELVCSPSVAQAAHDYSLALHNLARGYSTDDRAPSKRELRYAFLEAAREELGTASGPLRRQLSADSLGQRGTDADPG